MRILPSIVDSNEHFLGALAHCLLSQDIMFPPQSRTTRDLEAPHYSDELPPYVEDVEEVAKEKEAVTDEPRPSLQVDEHPARRDSTQTDEPRTSLSSADGLCLDSADDIRLDSFDESRKLTNPYESVGGGRFSKFSGVAKKALGYLAILLPTFLRRTSDSPKKLHSSAWLGRYQQWRRQAITILLTVQKINQSRHRWPTRRRSVLRRLPSRQPRRVWVGYTWRLGARLRPAMARPVYQAAYYTASHRRSAAGGHLLRSLGLRHLV